MPSEFSENSLSNYNSSADGRTFVIYPNWIYDYAHHRMPGLIADIEEAWVSIGDTWAELRLGWIGSTSEAAQEFNDQLQTAQNEMFGKKGATEEEDQPGIMRLSRAVAVYASSSYYEAEMAVTRMFDDFLNELGAPAAPGAQAPQGVDGGPVSIHYDNHNGVRYDNRVPIATWTDEDGYTYSQYEGEEGPSLEEKDFDGDGKKEWGFEVEKSWIDEKGNKHTETVQVEFDTWLDEKGNPTTQAPGDD